MPRRHKLAVTGGNLPVILSDGAYSGTPLRPSGCRCPVWPRRSPPSRSAAGSAAASSTKPGLPSTITVGTLLQDDRHQAPAQPQQSDTGTAAAEVSDDTPDPDRTGSADIVAAGDVDLTPEVEQSIFLAISE